MSAGPPPPPPPGPPGPPGPPEHHEATATFLENGYYQEPPKSVSPYLIVLNVINAITHVFIGATACSALWFVIWFQRSVNGMLSAAFVQHIFLCVFGYVILMGLGILSISPNTGWTNGIQLRERKIIHWVLQVMGSALAIAGSIIRINGVSTNFSTPHGIVGILALAFTCLSLIGGVINLFNSLINFNPRIIKVLHSCFGALTVTLAFICLILGFDMDMFRNRMGDDLANLSIAMTCFALAGIVLTPIISTFRRICN